MASIQHSHTDINSSCTSYNLKKNTQHSANYVHLCKHLCTYEVYIAKRIAAPQQQLAQHSFIHQQMTTLKQRIYKLSIITSFLCTHE